MWEWSDKLRLGEGPRIGRAAAGYQASRYTALRKRLQEV